MVLENIDEEEVVKLAKDMIQIRSFPGEERELAILLADLMNEHGIKTKWFEVEPGRKQPLGTIKGTGEGPSLMFNGHMDIDPIPFESSYPEGDAWKPVIKDGLLYGNGILNMKGGLTALVMAGVAIKRARIKLKGDLLIAPVVGELQGGIGTNHLIRKGIIPDMAVVPEPTNLDVRTLTAGVAKFLIHVSGITAHTSATDIIHNVNAVEKMTKVIDALSVLKVPSKGEKKFTYDPDPRLPGLPRMNIGGIIGGMGREYSLQRPAMVPDFCTISIDVRYLVGMTVASIKRDIEKVIESCRKNDPDIRYEVEPPPATYKEPWRAMKMVFPPCGTSSDEYIVRALVENHKYITGNEPKVGPQIPRIGGVITGGSYGGNDSGHLFAAGTKAVSYGPASIQTDVWQHQNIPVEQLINCTKVLALTALSVCTKSKSEIR